MNTENLINEIKKQVNDYDSSFPICARCESDGVYPEYDDNIICMACDFVGKPSSAVRKRYPRKITVGDFQSERMMGNQNYGNFIRIENEDEYNSTVAEIFINCRTRFEPKTLNKIGELGAYRDFPNEKKINSVVSKLQKEFSDVK